MARILLPVFAIANAKYARAYVTGYTVAAGVKTATKVTYYQDRTSSEVLANPQRLDGDGQFKQPVYVEVDTILSITGLSSPDHDTGIMGPSDDASAAAASAALAEQMANTTQGYAAMAAQSARSAKASATAAAAAVGAITDEHIALTAEIYS